MGNFRFKSKEVRMINKAISKVGWIGTGVMGKSMCGHLMKNGYQLSVYNRTRSKAEDLVNMGATYCETPRELASKVDYLVLMLGYPKDVEDMICHPEKGIMNVRKPNSYFI